MNKYLDALTGKFEDWVGKSYDSVYTRLIGSGALTDPKNREHATLTTTAENGSFTELANAKSVTFSLFLTAAATAKDDADQLLAHAWVTFDPPSDGVGDFWLLEADHLTDDSLRYKISFQESLEIDMPAFLTSYRIKAGHLAVGQTIGCIVRGN